MVKIWSIIQNDIDIITSLNPEEYPELCRLRTKTTVLLHLYAIMRHMQTYSAPVWPAEHPSYFLFSVRHLAKWSKGHGWTGGIDTWQSHKIFLLHAGLIKTHPVIGEQDDPILQSIWMRAVNKQQRSETLWTVPFYSEPVLRHAEQIAGEYRENHINLTKITKDAIANVFGQPTADRLYRSSNHVVSAAKKTVLEYLIRVMNQMIDLHGFTSEEEIRSEAVRMCCKETEIDPDLCAELVSKLMCQKRTIINNAGCEYHRIRQADRKMDIPLDYKRFIITRK